MGGEGHMLDMIKKLELNRTQRKEMRAGRFNASNKPRFTEEYLQNIENFDIERPRELSPAQKRKYSVLVILSLVFIIGVVTFLLTRIL